ncbi:hypothetical protein EVD19_15015 [Elizabethkingia meningoseptica]|nr:hypothetical protein EVD19_15015 [Elizabethkingia meningoseptica]
MACFVKVRIPFKIRKTEPNVTVKANNWVSLTPKAVALIIQEKAKILKEFKWTFVEMNTLFRIY